LALSIGQHFDYSGYNKVCKISATPTAQNNDQSTVTNITGQPFHLGRKPRVQFCAQADITISGKSLSLSPC
jgi:hypothetical protein